jgi:hypothetical protein
MKLSNDRARADKTPRQRPRFRIDRLEERIAPKFNPHTKEVGQTKNCPTDTCGDFCGGTTSY